jgi:soluble lytic murein transglycosylase-like protein
VLAPAFALADPAVLPPARPAAEAPAPATAASTALPETPPMAVVARPSPATRNQYLPLIEREAKARGLPSEVADAVARVESGYDPGAIGGAGERGLMQVMPPTAAMLGFKGSNAELADPETNVRYGVEYLAGAWKLANGDLCRALMKYRAGHNEERMSPLSVEYCRRARGHLAALGSPLGAGALPAPDFFPGGTTIAAGPRKLAGRTARRAPERISVARAISNRIWTSHMTRIRAIEARLPWKRGGIMAPG